MMRDRLIELLKKAPYGANAITLSDKHKDSILGEIADYLLESGVIVPPVKVGDIVYTNCSMSGWYMRLKDRPYEAKVVYLGINGKSNFMNVAYIKNDNMLAFDFSDIGKTVFLTREEAEKALKESEQK